MSSPYLLFLAACITLILRSEWVDAANINSRILVNSASTPASNATKTIAFSSAVEIEASVSAKLLQPSDNPAIPIPINITNVPEYAIVSRLAPALPPIQTGIGLPDTEQIIAHLIASTNSSTNESTVRKTLAGRQAALRVMIVGDSMSQGQEGDWTWRYRIWQWFQQNRINAEFVGPYIGTKPPQTASIPQPPPLYGTTVTDTLIKSNGSYAKGVDSSFLSNCNHFCLWGRPAAVAKGLIKAALEQNEADLILLMLGFNDMGWFYSGAEGTIDSIATLISNARAVNPKLQFAIANVPQRSFIGGREDLVENTATYNSLLPKAISKWSTDQSPIHLVDLAKNYNCQPGGCPAGYDGLHPNAWGEFLIANAFSQTLVNDFKLGSNPLPIPDRDDPKLQRALPVPSNFQVFSSPQGVSATWDPGKQASATAEGPYTCTHDRNIVYGAYSYDLIISANGAGQGLSGTTSQFNRWDSLWPLDGWTYTVSVRASAGDSIKGLYTEPRSAVARPKLAAPPRNVHVEPTEAGITVTWDPPIGDYSDSIVEYNVMYWDWASAHCQYINSAAFKSSPAVITGLNPGTNYLVSVEAWNANGEGLPIVANNAVPGAGIPPVPGPPTIDSKDQTSVRITWEGLSAAGGYRVWSRNTNDAGSKPKPIANVTDGTCNEEYFLFPGVWNYAFSISAFNGNEESARGPEVVAPSPTRQANSGAKCPPKTSWCSGGGDVSGGGAGSGSHGSLNISTLEEDFTTALALSKYDTSDFAAYNLTDLATRLIGFDGCGKWEQAAIMSGWQQSWKIMNYIYKIADKVDFNEAAAVDYLGPPAFNKQQQDAFKSIFKNLATIQPGWVPGWFAWKLAVRCDDPKGKCPCRPGDGKTSNLIAYTTNDDPKYGVARINFCPMYFTLETLDEVMYWANPSFAPESYANMDNYFSNQAAAWLHELLHIDWVSLSGRYGGNLDIKDIKILYETAKKTLKTSVVYGPQMCKALARWGGNPGYWIIQNSDSLVMYMMAKFVQEKLGSIYPHLPLAPAPPKGIQSPFQADGLFTMLPNGTAEAATNSSLNDLLAWSSTEGKCAALSDDDSGLDPSGILTLSAQFAVESDFPSDYLFSWSSWAGSSPTTTTSAPVPTATWSIAIYSDADCAGESYYLLEGHNDERHSDQCLVIHGGLGTDGKGGGVWCRWYTGGGSKWTKCDDGTLSQPLSWQIKNGICTAYDTSDCSSDSNSDAYYDHQGCHNYSAAKQDTKTWVAMKCAVNIESFLRMMAANGTSRAHSTATPAKTSVFASSSSSTTILATAIDKVSTAVVTASS